MFFDIFEQIYDKFVVRLGEEIVCPFREFIEESGPPDPLSLDNIFYETLPSPGRAGVAVSPST